MYIFLLSKIFIFTIIRQAFFFVLYSVLYIIIVFNIRRSEYLDVGVPFYNLHLFLCGDNISQMEVFHYLAW